MLSSYKGVKVGIADLGKKHYLRVFENRVLRRMLGGGGEKGKRASRGAFNFVFPPK